MLSEKLAPASDVPLQPTSRREHLAGKTVGAVDCRSLCMV